MTVRCQKNDDTTLLARLERSLRATAARDRKTITAGSFHVFIASHTDEYHMSFAVPRGPAPADWMTAIEALSRTFQSHQRRPRLEFFHERYPSLAAALETAGFQRDMTAPVMTLTRAALSDDVGTPRGRYVRLSHARSAELETFLRRQSLAYGGTTGDDALAWLPNLRNGLQDGTMLAAGLEQEGELIAGAAIMIGAGVGELAGVWTLPEKQRRGFAYRVCHALLADYFSAGSDLCWLSAAEGAQGIYTRLGFEEVGTQLNYGMPTASE